MLSGLLNDGQDGLRYSDEILPHPTPFQVFLARAVDLEQSAIVIAGAFYF
jgi:hypothetical protein